jgi:hypothetical protein|tara:strand:- start:253 stop:399 length:147 start_codon:yes stop_codon:yes gene_type:complete
VGILDELARGSGKLRAETWADLDPGMKFVWIITLITVPFGLLSILISL